MKKTLFLILTLLSAVNVYADSMYKVVSAITEALPMYGDFGSLNEIGYNEEENEVVAVFKCSDEYLANFGEFRKEELGSFIIGIFISNNLDLKPFNVVLIVKTPGNTTGKTFYIPSDDVSVIIGKARGILSFDNQASVDKLIESIQNTQMQCDPTGSFCYTLDFDKNANDIVINIQYLIEFDSDVMATEMDAIAEVFGKEIASSFKVFESVMKNHNIGLRFNMFQGTANEPFYSVKYSPEQIFGE